MKDSQISKTKRALTALLAVWLSGAVLLICCGTMSAKTSAMENCPLAAKGHCEKSSAETAFWIEASQTSAPFDCCAFVPQLFQQVKKTEPIHFVAATFSRLQIERPDLTPARFNFAGLFEYRSPPIIQSGIYLKNRVLRI